MENQFSDLAPGDYTLIIQDADGCESVTLLTIESANQIFLELGEDETILLGDYIELSVNTNMLVDSVIWEPNESLSCTSCLEPIAYPIEETLYSITVIDENGCVLSDEIVIDVDNNKRVFIPNTFSPNYDGINDSFIIYGGTEVKIIREFKIYNRWGANIFSASDFPPNDISYAWNGEYQGEELNPGVFIYFAEVEFLDGSRQLLSGEITLLK